VEILLDDTLLLDEEEHQGAWVLGCNSWFEVHHGRTCCKNKFRSRDLQYHIVICIEIEVMVAENVETNLDIINGACRNIIGMILHPDEPQHNNNAITKLPACVLIKLQHM